MSKSHVLFVSSLVGVIAMFISGHMSDMIGLMVLFRFITCTGDVYIAQSQYTTYN